MRDFRSDHADFDVTSPEGFGPVAGNVSIWLSGESRPVFVGTGYKVDAPWMDQAGRPIAPHRYNAIGLESEARTLGIRANGHVKLEGDCEVDAYDSTRGAYNQDGNYGAGAFISTNSVEAGSIEIGNGSVIWGTVQAGPGGAPGQVIDSQGLITGSTGTLAEPHPDAGRRGAGGSGRQPGERRDRGRAGAHRRHEPLGRRRRAGAPLRRADAQGERGDHRAG